MTSPNCSNEKTDDGRCPKCGAELEANHDHMTFRLGCPDCDYKNEVSIYG